MSNLSSGANTMLQQAMEQHRRGDLAAAERSYRAVLALHPKHPDALHLLGTIRADLGHESEGIALIEQALKLLPAMSDAHYNLGNIHRRRGDLGAAERHFRQAVKIQPGHLTARSNLGAVQTKLQKYGEAESNLRKVLASDPGFGEALMNLATLHEVQGRFDQTLPVYDSLLARNPQDAEAHYSRALALLLRGRLAEGWEEYRWRFRRPQTRAFDGQFPFPTWNGEDLGGKGILVWTEQGLGDELLMGTMLPDLVRRAGRVVLICSVRIAPLFARTFPTIAILPADDTPKDGRVLADVRFQASFSDLGRRLRPAFDRFPAMPGYLKNDAAAASERRQFYLRDRPQDRLIGLSWRSRNADLEAEKSLSLADLAPILKTPNCTFVSLQYGDCAEEIAATNRQLGTEVIYDHTINPVSDLTAFAAQTAAMDLVISVSNTTVHMAGALGVPTWALIPANRGRIWYWFLDRNDSPWYDSVRLFRAGAGGWGSAISAVTASVADLKFR